MLLPRAERPRRSGDQKNHPALLLPEGPGRLIDRKLLFGGDGRRGVGRIVTALEVNPLLGIRAEVFRELQGNGPNQLNEPATASALRTETRWSLPR